VKARYLITALLAWTCLTAGTPADVRNPFPDKTKAPADPDRILVVDGSNVHNVGNLLLHVGNWGIFGSWPGSAEPYSHAPSAEWPAGSGVEYLFTTGLWVGAIKQGIPSVSTSAFDTEFRPTPDPVDIIYHAAEGDPNGARNVDDDSDGQIDEDWLNGRDDDNDGQIDEDFAAISDQMFSCWFTDDQPGITQIFPGHRPLNVHVRQESYQWSDPRLDDFVGVEYTITNTGVDVLDDMYVGIFVDSDAGIGSRFLNSGVTGLAAEDDVTRYWSLPHPSYPSLNSLLCTDFGPVTIDVAYTYDADGDLGFSEGYFGVVLLGHTTDPLGVTAPATVGVSSFAVFSGQAIWENGGDPRNDFERYASLSNQSISFGSLIPRDYRMLMSVGPFPEVAPQSEVVFQVAFVMGAGLQDAVANTANAKAVFDGVWVNADGNSLTGIGGNEAPVPGPASNVLVDACACPACPTVSVPLGSVLYVNADCEEEDAIKINCSFTEADSLEFRTGVGMKETQVHWVVDENTSADTAKESGKRPRIANYPNPFNPTTTIAFTLDEPAHVSLSIYSVDGRRVRTLVDAPRPGGLNEVQWDGRDGHGTPVASGIYVCKVRTPAGVLTRKMIYLK
jgi:hypothetical protein